MHTPVDNAAGENRKQNSLLAWAVLALAVVARAVILWAQPQGLAQDPDAYVEIARHLVAGHGYSRGGRPDAGIPPHATAYRPPLYPLILAGVLRLGAALPARSLELTIGLLQLVLGAVTVWLTLAIGDRLRLGGARFLAAALVALDPILVQYTALPMTETLCTFLVTLWLWIAVGPSETGPAAASSVTVKSSGRGLLSGVVFGLCCLCRPTFLFLLVLATAWIQARALCRPAKSGEIRRAMLRAALAFLAGLLLVLAPWTIRNGIVLGKFTPATTHGGYTLLLANNPVFYNEVVQQPRGTVWQGPSLLAWQRDLEESITEAMPPVRGEAARDRWMNRRAWQNIAAEPVLFLRACAWRLVRFWDVVPRGPEAARLPRWLLAGVGMFYGFELIGFGIGLVALARGKWGDWLPLLGIVATLCLVHLVYWTDMRMRAPAIPAIALISALGWSSLRRKIGKA